MPLWLLLVLLVGNGYIWLRVWQAGRQARLAMWRAQVDQLGAALVLERAPGGPCGLCHAPSHTTRDHVTRPQAELGGRHHDGP